MKTNKKLLILTSMVILFPMLWGLIIWSQLPNQIPIHFNFAGQANNFQSKPLVVFGLPIFDLMVHLSSSPLRLGKLLPMKLTRSAWSLHTGF